MCPFHQGVCAGKVAKAFSTEYPNRRRDTEHAKRRRGNGGDDHKTNKPIDRLSNDGVDEWGVDAGDALPVLVDENDNGESNCTDEKRLPRYWVVGYGVHPQISS